MPTVASGSSRARDHRLGAAPGAAGRWVGRRTLIGPRAERSRPPAAGYGAATDTSRPPPPSRRNDDDDDCDDEDDDDNNNHN